MSVIIEFEVLLVRQDFREPLRLGRDHVTGRDVVIVRLVDDEGREGLGEMSDPPHPDAIATARAWAQGRTPMELEETGGPWALGVLPARLSGALDGALADLAARQGDISVARLLGGPRARSDVRVNALLMASGPADGSPDTARELVRRGFDTLKLKLAGGERGEPEPWWDETLGGVRAAVGDTVAVRLDLNGALTPETALAWLPSLVDLELEYLEQPIAPDHGPDRLAELRATGIRIAPDESVTDLGAALDLLEAGCDALVVKPARVGGPRRALAIIQAASELGVPVTISTLYETGVGIATALHLAAIVPGDRAHGLATQDLSRDDPVHGLPPVVQGRMIVPGPGLGLSLR
jgi:o-succinylbenzoate synthase